MVFYNVQHILASSTPNVKLRQVNNSSSSHFGCRVCRFGYPDATYLARVREELAAKGITSDAAELPAANVASPSPGSSCSSTSSVPTSTWRHVTVVTVTPSTTTSPSALATGADRGGQTLTASSSIYPDISNLTSSSSSMTSSVWYVPRRPPFAAGAQAAATTFSRLSPAAASTSQRRSSTSEDSSSSDHDLFRFSSTAV